MLDVSKMLRDYEIWSINQSSLKFSGCVGTISKCVILTITNRDIQENDVYVVAPIVQYETNTMSVKNIIDSISDELIPIMINEQYHSFINMSRFMTINQNCLLNYLYTIENNTIKLNIQYSILRNLVKDQTLDGIINERIQENKLIPEVDLIEAQKELELLRSENSELKEKLIKSEAEKSALVKVRQEEIKAKNINEPNKVPPEIKVSLLDFSSIYKLVIKGSITKDAAIARLGITKNNFDSLCKRYNEVVQESKTALSDLHKEVVEKPEPPKEEPISSSNPVVDKNKQEKLFNINIGRTNYTWSNSTMKQFLDDCTAFPKDEVIDKYNLKSYEHYLSIKKSLCERFKVDIKTCRYTKTGKYLVEV